MSSPIFAVTADPLDVGGLTAAVTAAHVARAREQSGEGPGGVATFLGLVRGQNQGRRVLKLDYEAFAPLAVKSFEHIAREAGERWPETQLGVHHRTGTLVVGEVSIVIVAASAHRSDAFAACRYAIERVKQVTPVWKHEYFEGGDVWIEGATADPSNEEARREAMRRACG